MLLFLFIKTIGLLGSIEKAQKIAALLNLLKARPPGTSGTDVNKKQIFGRGSNKNKYTKPPVPKVKPQPKVKKVKKGNVPLEQRDKKRTYTKKENDKKFEETKGKCEYCDKTVNRKDFRGDHRDAHGKGGRTDGKNHAASCKDCNSEKSDKKIGKGDGEWTPPNQRGDQGKGNGGSDGESSGGESSGGGSSGGSDGGSSGGEEF